MDEFYAGPLDARYAPMEPKTPCRGLETRPCIDWTTMVHSRGMDTEYRVQECPAGQCTRYERSAEVAKILMDFQQKKE